MHCLLMVGFAAFFGLWAEVPAWCLLCVACLVAGSLLGLFFCWLDLLPFQPVVGGPCLVPACHACLVIGCAAVSAGGRRCPPGGCLLGLLAWWLDVPLFRLVGGVRTVPASHGLLGGWQFAWPAIWWLVLLPFQLVVGGLCSVPACHACLVTGCAASSAGGRRCPPSVCLPCLPPGVEI